MRHCECGETRSNEYRHRADRDWWTCTDCDGRVRPLTDDERLDEVREQAQRITYEHEHHPGFDLWIERTPKIDEPDLIDIVIDFGSDDENPDEPKIPGFDRSAATMQQRVSLTLTELAWVAAMAPRLCADSALDDEPKGA